MCFFSRSSPALLSALNLLSAVLQGRESRLLQSKVENIRKKFVYLIAACVFVVGFMSLLTYAVIANAQSPDLTSADTIFPVTLHVLSVGMMVGLKMYYDLNDEAVGPLEAMKLVIRSRLWLFPGSIPDQPSTLKSANLVKMSSYFGKVSTQNNEDMELEFDHYTFSSKAGFPENRVMVLANEEKNWAHALETHGDHIDHDLNDKLIKLAEQDVRPTLSPPPSLALALSIRIATLSPPARRVLDVIGPRTKPLNRSVCMYHRSSDQ